MKKQFVQSMRPNTSVIVDFFGVNGLERQEPGKVQCLRADSFERAYTWGKGMVRYCILLDNGTLEPWVEGSRVHLYK